MSIFKNRKKKFHVLIISILIIFGGMTAVGINNYSKNYGYAEKLIKAMDNDDFDRFNQLLNQKGNVNSNRSMSSLFSSFTESNNMSPLRYACWLAKFDFVEPLLINGADPNLEEKGTSIIILCLMNPKHSTEEKLVNTIKLLIEYGANVNYKDKNDVSVLKRATVFLNDIYKNTISDDTRNEILKLLIDNGAQK